MRMTRSVLLGVLLLVLISPFCVKGEELPGIKNSDDGLELVSDGSHYYLCNGDEHYIGWQYYNGNRYYFYHDEKYAATGIATIGGIQYCFDTDGKLFQTEGVRTINGKQYYTLANGTLGSGWKTYNGDRYYFYYNEKYAATGLATIGGVQYFFESDGKLCQTEKVQTINGKQYYILTNGTLGVGWKTYNKDLYYFYYNEKYAATGLATVAGVRYYFESDGILCQTEKVQTINGKQYYILSNGTLGTGWKTYNGERYYFYYNERYAATNWAIINGVKYFFEADGKLCQTDKVQNIDGKQYFILSNGRSLGTGWKTYNGDRYYFYYDEKYAATGLATIGGVRYYFEPDGKLCQTEKVQTINGKHYFVLSNGMLGTGWKTCAGRRYYFYYTEKYAATGLVTIGGTKYYFEKDGTLCQTEKVQAINGKLYYVLSNGTLGTGWQTYNGNRYYFYTDEKYAATGTIQLGDQNYCFSQEGILIGNDPMIAKAQAYSSETNYLILVDCSLHRVAVFQGTKNNWTLIDAFPCTDGDPSTPTPRGSYYVSSKFRYFDSGDARCWYATGFITGEYLFHSILYYQEDEPRSIMDGTLGESISHGCVRLELSKCRWIYENVPYYSAVIIY